MCPKSADGPGGSRNCGGTRPEKQSNEETTGVRCGGFYPAQPQEGFVPESHPFMIAAAHPTPGVTEIAFVGQFIAHAPHSMQASR
jgi:hypothetical protein